MHDTQLNNSTADILLMNDKLENLQLLSNLLTNQGYNVRPTRNGADVFEALKHCKPALIMLDIRMPDLDGFEVCKRLKSDVKMQDIPVIFVSSSDSTKDKVRAFEMGGVDYIVKPYEKSEVLARVHTHLSLGQARDSLQTLTEQLQERVREGTSEVEQVSQDLHQSRERLRSLATHLQTISEEEKASFARELHDQLGSALTALKLDAVWLSKKLSQQDKVVVEKLSTMTKLLDTSLRDVRHIVTELRPTILDDLGLWQAIDWMVNDFYHRTGIKCGLKLECTQLELDPQQSITLFRIVQEAMTNIVRHANATWVEIMCQEVNGQLELKIRDNGIGLTSHHIGNVKSHGIRGMFERIYHIGGKLNIYCEEGTIIKATLPIAKAGHIEEG